MAPGIFVTEFRVTTPNPSDGECIVRSLNSSANLSLPAIPSARYS